MSRRIRRGFSLAEILVALAIIAIMSAVLLAAINTYMEQARIARIEQTTKVLKMALREFNRNVGAYPEELIWLTTKPTTGDTDICKNQFTQAMVDAWRGPYIANPITADGIVIESDTILSGLKRKPSNPLATADAGDLQIFMNNATIETATAVEADLEGDNTLTAGNVQWNTSSGYPRIIFAMPIAGC